MPVNGQWKKKDPLMFIGLNMNGEAAWTVVGLMLFCLWWVSGDGRENGGER